MQRSEKFQGSHDEIDCKSRGSTSKKLISSTGEEYNSFLEKFNLHKKPFLNPGTPLIRSFKTICLNHVNLFPDLHFKRFGFFFFPLKKNKIWLKSYTRFWGFPFILSQLSQIVKFLYIKGHWHDERWVWRFWHWCYCKSPNYVTT